MNFSTFLTQVLTFQVFQPYFQIANQFMPIQRKTASVSEKSIYAAVLSKANFPPPPPPPPVPPYLQKKGTGP